MFFSSPIDPFDLSKDWGRSDGDQRHRLVLDGSLRLPGGLDAGGLLQYYSSLPLNLTSGVTTVQGTAGRPLVDGAYIPRTVGQGSDFFSLGSLGSRVFAVSRVQIEAVVEAFNLTNRRNVRTRNATFGTGMYPSSPLSSFNQPTAVGESRAVQLGMRVRF